ncbi:hypothetical protein [Alcanivorax sp. UBA3183]|uniref:hypothetical protein n=1 Tax=Alcanivorax sp. UBA3183 TaxID=1945980 RepID=UPI00257D2BAE|nr:hypothetical protein [Alcanivorax sp. UBA3183]|tara:strand:- start:3175 stop:3711 length:537 start_codon:yes stop_codon:yes gene_type:complete
MTLKPLSGVLLLQSLRKHLGFFCILFFMGLAFASVGVGLLVWAHSPGDWGLLLFASLFALIGFGVLIMAFVTTYSSVGYYYERALLKEYGINIDGRVVGVQQYNQPEDGEETLWLMTFEYHHQGLRYEVDAMLPGEQWADKLPQQQWLPLRFLKPRPQVAEPRWRKLKNQLKLDGVWS